MWWLVVISALMEDQLTRENTESIEHVTRQLNETTEQGNHQQPPPINRHFLSIWWLIAHRWNDNERLEVANRHPQKISAQGPLVMRLITSHHITSHRTLLIS